MRSSAGAIAVLLALTAGCASDGDETTTSDVAISADPASSDPASSDPASTDISASSDPVTDTGAAETGSVTSDAAAGVRPEGFTTVTVRVVDADGDVCEVCMWLADDGDERGRGLMGVTELGEPAGMAFLFPEPIEGAFFMLGTPTPLSIAWFAPDGAFVSATDMDPCTTAAAECERFRSGGVYQLAIEVFRGGLEDLGIGPGATAELVAGAESDECVLAP